MNPLLLTLFQRLPAPIQELAATVCGYYLRRWRIGPDTERDVEAALEREHWSAAQWERWQADRLARTLHRAATRVPYYRERWARRRMAGDRANIEDLASWPKLTKDELRAAPHAFVADDRVPAYMFHEHTSGTSGKPLSLWFTRETIRAWYAIYEARVRRWHGVDYDTRWANIGGQQVQAFARVRPPFWVWNPAMHQLYMSSYHLAPAFVRAYLDALDTHRVEYMFGYSSSLATLAELAMAARLPIPRIGLAITNAEPLYAHQREAIAAAFGARVIETYGMAEMVCAASECENGTLHGWPEIGVTEVWDDEADTAIAPGQAGRLVCTGLANPDTMLIRYEVGDRATLATAETCACGRTLPHLTAVEGRNDDVLITADGRRIGRLDPVFKMNVPLREAQIVQYAIDRVVIRIVPTEGFSDTHARDLISQLADRIGKMTITVERVDHIARTSSGKFRAVLRMFAAPN